MSCFVALFDRSPLIGDGVQRIADLWIDLKGLERRELPIALVDGLAKILLWIAVFDAQLHQGEIPYHALREHALATGLVDRAFDIADFSLNSRRR